MNKLYYGDCLSIMRDKMMPAAIDLIYLDPPFNSKRDYNAIYKDETGRPLPNQIEAFQDTWHLDAERMRVIKSLPKLLGEHDIDGHSADFLAAFISGLVDTQSDMAAYLSYMAERLVWMKTLLKPTGSIYLHCDPTAGHYLKVLMDAIFGVKNYRNEIVWQRIKGAGKITQHKKRTFGPSVDTLLFYTKSNKSVFNMDDILTPYSEKYMKSHFKFRDHKGVYGRRSPFNSPGQGARPNQCYSYKGFYPPHPSGWNVTLPTLKKMDEAGDLEFANGRVYRKQRPRGGIMPNNLWTDINPAQGKEQLGYKTQKPLALLERIIKVSSQPNDLVFDPFCGCATTIEAAHTLGRRWVGIDITIHAIKRVARVRLQERLHLVEGKDYLIEGVPRSWEGAYELWKRDTYHFQKWCVEQVEGFVTSKRTADGGIDGRIYFELPGEKTLQSMALEVKGGKNVGIKDVRALSSSLQHKMIQMTGLITLWQPSRLQMNNFNKEMAKAGHLKIDGKEYPRMQLLTVQKMLDGYGFHMPRPVGKTETGYDADLFSHTFNQSD